MIRQWALVLALVGCMGTGTPPAPPTAVAPASTSSSMAGEAPGKGARTMMIKTAETTVAVTKPISVEITYSNPTDRAVVLPISPEKSLEIEMHLVDQRTREDLSYTMGKTETTNLGGDDQYALVLPRPEAFHIAARSAFVFTSDLHERLFLRPGKFDCYVSEGAERSNSVALTIELTRESVDALFAVARDPKADYSRREWAAALLQKLYRSFTIELPAPGDPRASEKEADNEGVYEEFAAWWARSRKTSEMDETLRRIR